MTGKAANVSLNFCHLHTVRISFRATQGKWIHGYNAQKFHFEIEFETSMMPRWSKAPCFFPYDTFIVLILIEYFWKKWSVVEYFCRWKISTEKSQKSRRITTNGFREPCPRREKELKASWISKICESYCKLASKGFCWGLQALNAKESTLKPSTSY